MKITKIGGSNYIIVPAEYIKVFNMGQYVYDLEVSQDGKTLTYKQNSKIKETD